MQASDSISCRLRSRLCAPSWGTLLQRFVCAAASWTFSALSPCACLCPHDSRKNLAVVGTIKICLAEFSSMVLSQQCCFKTRLSCCLSCDPSLYYLALWKPSPWFLILPPASRRVWWDFSSSLFLSSQLPMEPWASKLLKLFCIWNLSSCLSETRPQQLANPGDSSVETFSWGPNLVCVLSFLSHLWLWGYSLQWSEWF